MAQMLASSEMVPKQYKGKPQDTLIAMMMGTELGLNPIQSLQNIAVINGKPSIYGDALLALVQNHRSFGGIEENFDDSTMTATCTVWRKGGNRHTQTFSQADAKAAGLWGKAGPWTQYGKRMLQMRARGFAVRGQFADALAGLITREEAEDIPVSEYDITPDPQALPELPDITDALQVIADCSTMADLQREFTEVWKAYQQKELRAQLSAAKDAKKKELANG